MTFAASLHSGSRWPAVMLFSIVSLSAGCRPAASIAGLGSSSPGGPLEHESSIKVAATGPVIWLHTYCDRHSGAEVYANTETAQGPPPGTDLTFFGRMPESWDARKTMNQDAPPPRVEIPIDAQLVIDGIAPITVYVHWTSSRGGFSFFIPVAYPPNVDHAKLLFYHGGTKPVSEWTLTNLPRTKDATASIKAGESATTAGGTRVTVAASLHRGLTRDETKGAIDEILVGAGIASDGSGATLKNIHVSLPFSCLDGGVSSANVGIDGARAFSVALPTLYADQTEAVRFEATVVEAEPKPTTLKVGKVLLQKTPLGLTVAGRHWTTTVDGFAVSVNEARGDEVKRTPGTVSMEVYVRPVVQEGGWFELALSNGTFAGKDDMVVMQAPVREGQQEIELTLHGRVVKAGIESNILLRVPVKSDPLPKQFPPYREDLSVVPSIVGKQGGYAISG